MRIGIVTGEYPPLQGGVGAYSRIIAQTFTQQGHQVFIFSDTQTHEDDPAIALTNPVKQWRLGALRTVRQWARTNQLDIVNLQYETACYAMSPWIHFLPDVLRGVPLITTFHDLLFPYLFPKAGRLRDWIVMRLARASAGVIATNHEDMEQLKQLPNATLIPIGSNILTTLPENFNRIAWREKVGATADDFLLAHFGFMNRSKGIETLLAALAILRSEGNPTKLLLIGGRTGSSDPANVTYADAIEAQVTQLGLTEYITWTGFVNDEAVTAYLNACDAVVLPFRDGASYRRGTLMAAIQHGCAIVTTQPQVAIPTFRDGENMLLSPAGNASALAESIKQLRANADLRAKLGKGAQELRQNFDWEIIAQNHLLFFEKLIGS